MCQIGDHTAFERKVVAALRVAKPERTAACLEPDDLLLLIDRGDQDPASAPLLAHTAACAYCRREYVRMRKALLEAEQLRAERGFENQPNLSLEATRPALTEQPIGSHKPSLVPTWLTGLRQRFFSFPSLGYALAPAAAVALIFVIMIRPLQTQNGLLVAQVERLQADREQLAEQLNQQQRASAAQIARAEKEKSAIQIETEAKVRWLEAQLREAERRQVAQNKPSNSKSGSWAERELAKLKTPKVQIAWLLTPEQKLMSGSQAGLAPISLISPVATLVQEERPVLSWKPVEGALTYTVSLHRLPDYKPVLPPVTVAGTEWQVPFSLQHGRMYAWQVEARKGGDSESLARSSEARFQVMERTKVERVSRIESRLRMELGELYSRAGLFHEAMRELSAVPPSSPLYTAAQKRLREVQGRLGR